MLFTIQPGGAVPSQPLPITFPNLRQDPPGGRSDLYFFDLIAGNWAIWGQGTVGADSAQIVSDPGAGCRLCVARSTASPSRRAEAVRPWSGRRIDDSPRRGR